MTNNYYDIEGLKDVYLEDSYLLDIKEKANKIEFIIEAVLCEGHSEYSAPIEGQQYCFKKLSIIFEEARDIKWLDKKLSKIKSLDGENIDYGNIDSFKFDDCKYILEGEWGRVEISSLISPVLISLG